MPMKLPRQLEPLRRRPIPNGILNEASYWMGRSGTSFRLLPESIGNARDGPTGLDDYACR